MEMLFTNWVWASLMPEFDVTLDVVHNLSLLRVIFRWFIVGIFRVFCLWVLDIRRRLSLGLH